MPAGWLKKEEKSVTDTAAAARTGPPRSQAPAAPLRAITTSPAIHSATAAGMRSINQTRVSPDRQFERLAVAARLCPTWLQTCVFALDGKPPSEAEQAAYLAAVARIRQQSIPVQGVLLYGLARPSMQPQAGRLSALPAEWLEAFAEKIRAAGLPVLVSP